MHGIRYAKGAFCAALLTALLVGAAFAGEAAASPEWHFNGALLTRGTTETVTAEAASASMGIPGLKTTCEPLVLELEVENLLGGPGVGEVIGASLNNCHTDTPACTVETANAGGLPWPVHLTTIGVEHYLVVEDVEFSFFYGGEECVLSETLLSFEGDLGGLVNDSNQTVTFNSTTMSTVGAQLKLGSTPIAFNGVFSWFPTGGAGSPLTVL